ncbi:amidohydrolase family protein [Paenibacillus rhizoplanae]
MKHNYPILLDDVAVDFPDLTLIVEHMGHPWNDLCYYMVGRHDNMYVTITAVANILIHNNPKVFRMELAKNDLGLRQPQDPLGLGLDGHPEYRRGAELHAKGSDPAAHEADDGG